MIGKTDPAFLDYCSNDVVQIQIFDLIPFVEAGSHTGPFGTKNVKLLDADAVEPNTIAVAKL